MYRIDADYLVVGCGAAAMAFTDALVAARDEARVVMVDRRHAPGGHWLDAYPFVRLHQPSSYYGVNSLSLGDDAIDEHGPNQGLYERATAPEICGYYSRVMERCLLPTGRVRYFPMCDYVGKQAGAHRFVSRASHRRYEVDARAKLVDATYLQAAVPASTPPPFHIAPEARCVPINELTQLTEPPEGYVIIGAGKTAIDACLWLLELGVAPNDIRWIRPREGWWVNREYSQGGELVGKLLEGLALQLEAAARAISLEDLFRRLNDTGQLLRIDERVAPTMYKGATVSLDELEQLRRIENVVRLGHVRRVGRDEIELAEGTIVTSPRHLHVHCAARGLNPAPAVPMFTADRITLQPIRGGLIPFNAALVGYVEATRDDLAEKNRLCPPNPLPDSPLDWARSLVTGLSADYLWSKEPDINEWLERSRLNASRGLRSRRDDPTLRSAWERFGANVGPGLARLGRFLEAT